MGGTKEAHNSACAPSTTIIIRGFTSELVSTAILPRSPCTRKATDLRPLVVSSDKKYRYLDDTPKISSYCSAKSSKEEVRSGHIQSRMYRNKKAVDPDNECAISDSSTEDDDDSSDWENISDKGAPSSDDEVQLFPRVDCKPNLESRGSLLTRSLYQHQRAAVLAQAASQSGPAMQRSRTTSKNDALPTSSFERQSSENPGGPAISQAKPILNTTVSPVFLPRNTRRVMLQTEWPKSLRHAILWERQHLRR